MSLNDEFQDYCTPEARELIVNVPTWTRHVTYTDKRVQQWTINMMHGQSQGLIMYGKTGTHKTGNGCAALLEMARSGVGSVYEWNMLTNPHFNEDTGESFTDWECMPPVYYNTFTRLLAKLRPGPQTDGMAGYVRALDEQVSVLMLDDLATDRLTSWRQAVLLETLEWANWKPARYIVLSLNTPPQEWQNVFGDRVADRFLDKERFVLVEMVGNSRRS